MFDPSSFLYLAQGVKRGEEASLRTSVDRAYYAAFLLIRDRLSLKHGLNLGKDPQVHQKVVAALHKLRKHKVGQRLHRLRGLRNLSSYDTSVTINGGQTLKALSLAQFVVDQA